MAAPRRRTRISHGDPVRGRGELRKETHDHDLVPLHPSFVGTTIGAARWRDRISLRMTMPPISRDARLATPGIPNGWHVEAF